MKMGRLLGASGLLAVLSATTANAQQLTPPTRDEIDRSVPSIDKDRPRLKIDDNIERSVVASHWPVPDDFDATQRLIGGVFRGEGGEDGGALSTSLRLAQEKLMDDPITSHPYYWAAFVVLGDGSKPLLSEE